jgi:hypothetical protein
MFRVARETRTPVAEPQRGKTVMNSDDPSAGKMADNQRRPNERRKRNIPVAVDRRAPGTERRKSERRRQVDPTTCERDYNDDEIEFMKAMDQYKRDNRRPFPTWSEVLEVLRALGYRKVAEPTALPGLAPAVPQKG